LHIDIEAEDLQPINERLSRFTEEVGKILHIKTGKPEYVSNISGDRILIREYETYGVRIGVASRKRRDSSMSGDTGTYFKTEEGVVYVILSDGMGSGREAAIESATVVRLLERFIRAGIETESALRTINSALMLRNIDEGGFATLDLLEINLFDGFLRIFKCGAAPTYIKENEKVRMISGKVFPPGAGILPTVADVVSQNVSGGEVLVLMSDGAYLPENDAWLRKELIDYKGGTPKKIAGRISTEAATLSFDADDSTIAVVEIVKK
jgi:stage II sporulation protein E